MRWTPERKDMLEQMWLWGLSSNSIAANMGDITRNAVMGKVNTLGLMGRGGERLGMVNRQSGVDAEDVGLSVSDMLRDKYDILNPVHRAAATAITTLFTGRNAGAIEAILRYGGQTVAHVLADLHATGVWREGAPPPNAWWHHSQGFMSFTLDMMACTGMIAIANPNARDTNERSYKGV